MLDRVGRVPAEQFVSADADKNEAGGFEQFENADDRKKPVGIFAGSHVASTVARG